MSDAAPTTIRALQSEDEARLCAGWMSTSEPWLTVQRTFDQSLQSITDPQKETYLALVEDRPAGFIILNLRGAFVGYLQSLCVAPEWRAKGIGTQLIAYAEVRIFRDFPNVFICVSSFNPDARKLYERLGYELVGEMPNYIVAGHSEFLLRKTIAPIHDFYQR